MNTKQEFIGKYNHQSFPHAEQLFTAFREMECEVTTSKPRFFYCRHYEEIYRFRANYFAKKKLNEKSPAFYNDMVYLYETLAKTPDERCCLWIFDFSNGQEFAVFEVVESSIIAGCLLFNKIKMQVGNIL